jgi:hypothetical protein
MRPLVLCGVQTMSAAPSPTPWHNVGFLGQGYDLVRANPRPSQKSGSAFDPGWMDNSVFGVCPPNQPSCAPPDNVNFLPTGACSYDGSIEEVGSSFEYSSSLATDVSFSAHEGFAFDQAKFSGSMDYTTAKDDTGSDFKFYSSVSALCESYHASFAAGLARNASWLSDSFRGSVAKLPTAVNNSTLPAFKQFALNYGTHYAKAVKMGGKAMHTVSFNKVDYSHLSSSGSDVRAAASISFGVWGGAETSASASSRSKDYAAFSSKTSTEHITCVGAEGVCPKMTLPLAFDNDWVHQVKASPAPISYTLESLDVLLTSVYFPGDADIIAKQTALYNFYVNNYCGNVAACDAPLPAQYWLGAAPMSTPRAYLAVGVLGAKLYAVGGHDNDYHTLASVEAYDPGSNQWSATAPRSTPRSFLAVGVLGAKLYAVGGYDGNNILASVEAYDPGSNQWSAVAPMSTPRYIHAVGVLGAKLYAVGGQARRQQRHRLRRAFDR